MQEERKSEDDVMIPREKVAGQDKFTSSAILTLMGAFSAHLVVGAQYSWGSLSPYIVGYYRYLGFQDTRMSQFYAILPIIVITSTLFFPLGMYLAQRSARWVVALGGSIAISCVLVSSVMYYPSAFFVIYAIGFGIGKGFMYPAPLRAGWSHLKGRVGFVSGLIISGLGFGASIFGLVATLIVNPENKLPIKTEIEPGLYEYYFPDEVNARVPYMLKILCLIWTYLILFACLTITNYKEPEVEEHLQPLLERADALTEAKQKAEKDLPLKYLLCSVDFFHIYLMSLCQIFYGYYIINVFKSYGAIYIKDDAFLTFIGGVGAIANGVFRIFWSTLLDYYSFKSVYAVLLSIQILMILAIQWAVMYRYTYLIVISASMMCEGAITSMLPKETNHHFGLVRGPAVYSFMFSSFGVSALLGSLFVYLFQDAIGYFGMFVICLSLTMVTAILLVLYKESRGFDYLTKYHKVNKTKGEQEDELYKAKNDKLNDVIKEQFSKVEEVEK